MHAAVLERTTVLSLTAMPVFCPDLGLMQKLFEDLAQFKATPDYWRDAYGRDDCPRLLLSDKQEAAIRAAGTRLSRAFAFLEAQEQACYPRNVPMSQLLTYYRDLAYCN